MECNKCKKQKEDTEFYLYRGKQRNPCKECAKKIERIRYNSKKDEINKRNREYQKSNRPLMNKIHREARRNKRIEVLKHYGSKCACCGENEIKFLAVDHINGDGSKHRIEIRNVNIYYWLIRNNYPDGFQLLCHNCNYAKHFYKVCPHKNVR